MVIKDFRKVAKVVIIYRYLSQRSATTPRRQGAGIFELYKVYLFPRLLFSADVGVAIDFMLSSCSVVLSY